MNGLALGSLVLNEKLKSKLTKLKLVGTIAFVYMAQVDEHQKKSLSEIHDYSIRFKTKLKRK